MSEHALTINGKKHVVDVDTAMPLLWFLRDSLELTGTKYGCGMGICGACTVHLDGRATRACQTPVSAALGKEVTTIEGLADDGLHALQEAWLAHNVPQCGYCQAGQIMSAADLLSRNPSPTVQEIDGAMQGNVCRCGTYLRIREAVQTAAVKIQEAT